MTGSTSVESSEIGMNPEDADLDPMLELTNEFQDESDRAAAVLAAAYLDELLGDLIAAKMQVDDDEVDELLYRDGFGPLGPFSARINVAYCMSLLSGDEHRDLHLIRKIRNDFAHKLSGLSFETQDIANRCNALYGAEVDGKPRSPRGCFTKASVRLMLDLILRIRKEKGSRLGSGKENGT